MNTPLSRQLSELQLVREMKFEMCEDVQSAKVEHHGYGAKLTIFYEGGHTVKLFFSETEWEMFKRDTA